jgi:hypothetical protein
MDARRRQRFALFTTALTAGTLLAGTSLAAEPDDGAGQVILGIKISAGGRYDTVRRCVATEAGTPGGPAADVSFFGEFGITDRSAIVVDLPVFRPILFGAAFGMLQFEPEVTLVTRATDSEDVNLVVGAGLGLSLHYGPDYTSELDDATGKPSFFALGPRSSLYLGLDMPRPGEMFNFQIGLRPYITALSGIDDPEEHMGAVIGGQLEGQLRFDPAP